MRKNKSICSRNVCFMNSARTPSYVTAVTNTALIRKFYVISDNCKHILVKIMHRNGLLNFMIIYLWLSLTLSRNQIEKLKECTQH
jgi:hypothetical protein